MNGIGKSRAKINILLVDDNSANLLALAAVLDRPEYHIVLAHSGKEALETVRDRDFAVILLDVQMPEMDGFETARRIRILPSSRDVPIIFVTANYREDRFVQHGYASGGVDYLFKPLDPEIVKSKVGVFVELFLKNKTLRLQQERMARLVSVQRITTDALANSASSESVIPDLLKEICKTLGWDMGTFWNADRGENVLGCKYFWSDPSCPAGFVSGNAKEVFAPGVGLPGRVWLGGRALWAKEGLGSAVAFPVPVNGNVTGVMEFFCRESQMEDLDLLKIMSAVGSQIGQFIARMEALQAAEQAIRARDEFISIASHELRTPLTVLRIQAQLNRNRLEKNDPSFFSKQSLEKFLKVSVGQVERMISLVENMLDISRITHGQLRINTESFDLSDLVKRVAEGLTEHAESKGAHLVLKAQPGIDGEWDPLRLEQVVSNLIINAIKYGGAKKIEIGVSSGSNTAQVTVKDHGPGIAPENLERIFGRFERAVGRESTAGLGLGLYISRQIVAAHGGRLTVQSEVGKGAVFKVELPTTAVRQNAAEG